MPCPPLSPARAQYAGLLELSGGFLRKVLAAMADLSRDTKEAMHSLCRYVALDPGCAQGAGAGLVQEIVPLQAVRATGSLLLFVVCTPWELAGAIAAWTDSFCSLGTA